MPTNILGAPQIYLYETTHRGTGRQTAIIALCVVYLFCWNMPFYCSISKLSKKVTPHLFMHTETPFLWTHIGLQAKNVYNDQLTIFKRTTYLRWIPYSFTVLLAQRKCHCYEEIWETKCVKTLKNHCLTYDRFLIWGSLLTNKLMWHEFLQSRLQAV
jgi:hypothetical protein